VKDGRLCAVIDFGCFGIGDPSCDLVIAWTFLGAVGREKFRAATALDPATWERARGWAIWKALISLAQHRYTNAAETRNAHRVLNEILR
jgi:aminoglycoside phosphotransferase (APT) family kinase protein